MASRRNLVLFLQNQIHIDDALAAVLLFESWQRKSKARKRSFWTRSWFLRRAELGQYHTLMRELELEDLKAFKNYVRVDPQFFHELLQKVGPVIQRRDTYWRESLPAGMRLAITLRYLATGNSYMSLR